MAKSQLTGIRFDDKRLRNLKYIAKKDRRTFTEVVKIAVDDYLEKWEKEHGSITDEMRQSVAED